MPEPGSEYSLRTFWYGKRWSGQILDTQSRRGWDELWPSLGNTAWKLAEGYQPNFSRRRGLGESSSAFLSSNAARSDSAESADVGACRDAAGGAPTFQPPPHRDAL